MSARSRVVRAFRQYQLHLLMIIPLIWVIVFRYVPMYGAQIAFRDYRVGQGIWGSAWVGLKYFRKFFSHYKFWNIIRNTVWLSVYQMLAGWLTPIIVALSLNVTRNRPFKRSVQMITYAPHFISVVVMVGIILQFTSPEFGIINKIIKSLGLEPIRFMSQP